MVIYNIELGNGRKLDVNYTNLNHDNLMIFIPGVSGHSSSERFKYLDDLAINCNYSLAKMDYQFQQFNDNTLTMRDCVNDVLALVEYLRRRDINIMKRIVILAKSFGGLIYHLLNIDIYKGILLAPYTKLSDKEMDFLDTKLGEIQSSETYLNKNLLRNNPTLIFHGTRDETIEIYNSETMTELNNKYTLIKVDSDHGLHEEEIHKKIINKATNYILE